MTKSTITVKNQTTVPREIRIKLAVGPSDILQWEVIGNACW
jgi:bifunctional DNA-binding transcriptional regulator/antitoxin component of YhaV-PrlF toxin-antitoxin module